MPVKSEKQRKFMQMIAHGGTPYGGTGPSPEVAREMLHGGDDKKTKGKKTDKKKKKSLWDRIKEGGKKARELPEKSKPKKRRHNPGY